ncbi:hypothetical protein MEG_01841 [Bartonella tamiae Th307]|uniref:Uncharacterized protein n=1 Tax=Bartonella tamiae Th239 TaxID=1094558 RepID=J0R7E1_9HYPH|nr:hypothetical protein ME5_00033 [Bartonella tamiae Th239]EJF92671.1 hypothetical protein MEG_01841 [Bartonella tamiae Th307]
MKRYAILTLASFGFSFLFTTLLVTVGDKENAAHVMTGSFFCIPSTIAIMYFMEEF